MITYVKTNATRDGEEKKRHEAHGIMALCTTMLTQSKKGEVVFASTAFRSPRTTQLL